MEDSRNIIQTSENGSSSSSLRYICANEMIIRNHPYILSMCINHSEQQQLDIKIESKENADQWKSSFNSIDIEKMTTKTGNYKSFNVFVNMLENAINQKSSSVSIDLFTYDDLQLIRKNEENEKKISSTKKSSKKRYLILIYNSEYDCIYYPLSLRYSGKPNPVILIEQIRQLATENHLLKSRVESDNERLQLQEECIRLKKENDDYRQELLLLNSKEKDQQIEYLREMIRTSENILNKERNHFKKTKTKKDDRYKSLINQIDSLKISERQLKLQLKSLTNEINLINKNGSSYKLYERSSSLSRPNSTHKSRHHSINTIKRITSSTDSHVRFNPTDYIHQKNLKLQQIQLQKKKETRERLNSGRCHSDSDISDITLKVNENQKHSINTKKKSRGKRSNNPSRQKSNDSLDSDIEGVLSPLVLHKAASNNSIILVSHDVQQNISSNPTPNTTNNMIDIDHRLKSLEKFIKQNFQH